MHMLPLVIEPEHDQLECALVLVDGTVNGRPCRFVLDTGAARSQIVADETFADLAAGVTSSSGGVLGTSVMPLAPIAELALGPLRASNLEVWLLTDPHQPGAHHLLGMDLLIGSCCRFLFKQAALRLEPSPSPEATEPLTLAPGGHSYLTLTWPAAASKLADETTQQVTAQACWDTGATITVVDQTFFQAHPHLFSEPGTAIATDSNGTQASMPTYTMAGPEIGGHRFASHKVAVVDLSPVNPGIDQPTDLILGYPTLCQAEWLFDYPARRWAITGRPNA